MKNLLIVLFICPLFALAQKTHTVQPKETLYSLARKYNVHPRELAAYNDIPVTTSLSVGQVIKIPAKTTMDPLPPTNETPKPAPPVVKEEKKEQPVGVVKSEGKGRYPMYHKVEKKETLYRISKIYPNITIEDIRKWNNLGGDGLSEGMNLIVGYSDKPNAVPHKTDLPEENPPVVVKQNPEPEKRQSVEPAKPEAVKAEPVKSEPVVKSEPPATTTVPVVKSGKGGSFKSIYNDQVANRDEIAQRGKAGIFKSTSGWDNGKYYCLSNSVPPGAIVKITNTANNKVIYARVLDLMPDLKQNADMVMRLSNAGADELGVSGDSFDCTISY